MRTESSSDTPVTNFNTWSAEQWKAFENAYFRERLGIQIHLRCKRLLDIAIASTGIVIILPILALVALAVRLSSPGPILFVQQRTGKLGIPFQIYKFRTMVDGAIHQGAGLRTFKGDPRVTPVGKFLREYHLDELPQLFNVLRGEMSLVGPRPLLPRTSATYTDRQKRRLLVKPGITAWEAVSGGLDNSLEERLGLDVWYVDHLTLWLDLVILARTIPVVLWREGIYEKTS